jgi:hypothetical protein
VTATKSAPVDSNIAVSGTIKITNPAPKDAIVSIKDVMGTSEATVKDGSTVVTSVTVPAHGSKDLTYTMSSGSPDSGTNTATASLQNYAYKYDNTKSALGVKDYSGSASVTFTPTVVHDSVTVSDDKYTISDPTTSVTKTWGYYGNFGPYAESDVGSPKVITNTVTLKDSTTEEQLDQDDATVTVNVNKLTVTKTADTSFTRTYDWSITKVADPTTWNLFVGDKAQSKYTVTATKLDPVDSDFGVSGTITISNPASVPVTVDVADAMGTTTVTVYKTDTPVTQVTVPAKSSVLLSYEVSPSTGTNQVNTASATMKTYSYNFEKVPTELSTYTYEGTAKVDFSKATITTVHDSVTVSDDKYTITDPTTSVTKTWTYYGDFGPYSESAVGTPQVITNTVTLKDSTTEEQLDEDDATVTVNVYYLGLEHDPIATYERTYTWAIDKSADETEITLQKGVTANVDYTVIVTCTGSNDDGWAAEGYIELTNTAPFAVTINSVDIKVLPDIDAIITGEGTQPYVLKPAGQDGSTIKLYYDADLPSPSVYTVKYTIEIQNYIYKSDGTRSSAGTTVKSDEASIDCAHAIMTDEIDEVIDVSDTYAKTLGSVTYSESPKTFSYTRTVGPYDTAVTYYVDNTATFVARDTGATDDGSWEVIIHVPDAGTITGYKFYDTNRDGAWDKATEPAIQGWKVSLTYTTDSGLVTEYAYTDADGM